MSCVFCRIVRGDEPAQVVHEDEHTVAFLNLVQATRGHTLVVPRAHHRDLGDVPLDVAERVMRTSAEVARRLTGALKAAGRVARRAGGDHPRLVTICTLLYRSI
ncbi:histidine triad (HIT) family protein [Nonomuraea solani]|uniref:Histidine triad (HIT) family protein n=1 Tax=Nonomuraea solani TaxID=1144553 RepID=A0A1H6E8U3_9ACTN|nr:HIT domain-containing protein [Nonomuraea solani]SEG94117.1 histidine triad (HIT) family protein [Nonomuraea solani]